MDLTFTDEQQDLRETLAAFFSKESTVERVRASEPTGFDIGLWDQVAAMGLPSMGVGEDLGGGGATLLDLVLTAEEFGRRIPPVPLIEAAVATNLLGRLSRAGGTEARDLMGRAVSGEALVSLALEPLRGGVAKLAPAGAVADAVLALDGDELVAFRSSVGPRSPLAVPANLGTAPLADRGAGIDERIVLASGPDAVGGYAQAQDEWRVLMAGALVGLAQTALDMGSEYVQQRRAFGVLIASFQTVQHRLADAVTDLEGARVLLTYEAGWSADEGLANAAALAAMALLFTAPVAFRIAAENLHFHGGYGYTLEYDIQLYFRRAKAWPLALGDPGDGYQELAARLFEHGSAEMDFVTVDDLAEHRQAAREWIARNVRPEWAGEQYRSGTHHTVELHEQLARDGILGAGWPAEYGGSATQPDFARAVLDEVTNAGLYTDGWATTNMVIRTISHVGTEEQKRTIIPAALRGEILIAVGYSEPDSGSDVAAAKTRAVKDGDEWVIDGQKMFTSTAESSSHVFVLARSNLEVPKHKGLTMFLVPTDVPGFDLQPIYTLGGQRTNATFYSDLRVPDSLRIGGIDEGWRVMRVALVFERGGRGPAGPSLAERTAAWAMSNQQTDGTTLYDDPRNRERLARIAIDEEVGRLLGLRVRWMTSNGELPGVEGSMIKLFASEAAQRHYSQLLDMLGSTGVLQPGAPGAPLEGDLEAHFRSTVVGTIYGGASEIQREIIAEGRLGLPRNRPKS